MTDPPDQIRTAIQKLTEAIWNLDQLQPLEPSLQAEYELIQTVRGNLMKLIRNQKTG